MADRVPLVGLDFDALSEPTVVERVLAELQAGRGGWILTPNVDILRRVAADPESRELATGADLIVADGMPLLWIARLLGRPLRGRVAGASLLWSLSAAAAADGRSVFLLGAEPGVAATAAARLQQSYPELRVAGVHSPPPGFEHTPGAVEQLVDRLQRAAPDIVFVGLGFPKQERLITALGPSLPNTWFLACGAAIAFAAGTLQRAPVWMQSMGMEWVHRLVSEPRRLFRRYVVEDIPFALRVLGAAAGTAALTRMAPEWSSNGPERSAGSKSLRPGAATLNTHDALALRRSSPAAHVGYYFADFVRVGERSIG